MTCGVNGRDGKKYVKYKNFPTRFRLSISLERNFYFSEFDHWVKTVCLEQEIFYFVPTCVIDESFPKDGFCVTLSEYFVSYFGKSYTAIFVSMAP